MASSRARIVTDPKIHHGALVIRGTRVPLARLVGGVAGGMTLDEVAMEYGVEPGDVKAALELAAELIDREASHSLPGG